MISCYLCNTEYIRSTSNILIDDDASILSLAYVNIDLVPGHVYTKSIYKNNRHGSVIEYVLTFIALLRHIFKKPFSSFCFVEKYFRI